MGVENVLDLLKYVLPALVVFFTAYFIFDTFAKRQIEQSRIEYQSKTIDQLLPLKLQAYERLALFIERISPNSLIPRVSASGMSAQDLQLAMIGSIRSEFEHNLTQQIYVSNQLWSHISNLKEEIIKMIVAVGKTLPEGSTGADMSKAVFQFMLNQKSTFPTVPILELLKQEVRELY